MVGRDGRVKVLDFGLAKRRAEPAEGAGDLATATLAAVTREGTILGTAPYMSPEQIQGQPVDARSDVFSLGILFYEMLAGRRPFAGDNPASLASSILRDPPPPLQEVRPELPRHLGRIVALCLEKRVAERCQSAADVRNQLEQLRRELAVDSAPSRSAPSSRSLRRAGAPRWRGAVLPLAAAVALLVPAAYLVYRDGSPAATADQAVAIAVLPLVDLSGDPEQEYFADGMTEALITSLARIDGLHVISRTSVVRYKGTGKSAPEIAAELGVRMLLEGTVLRAGERVRIAAQLIDAREDRPLWAESYERDLRDVFSLQSEVARAVAREVAVELSPEEQLRLARTPEVAPEAYEEYLKGEHFYSGFRNLEGALESFERAAELDPSYAPAQVGVSKSLAILGYVHRRVPRAVWEPARRAADRALALDGHLAEAHAARGRVQLLFDWDWAEATTSLDRALELNRSSFDAHEMRSVLHLALGEHERDIAEMRRALALDPLSVYANARLGWSLGMARRYGEAVEHLREALKLHPEAGSLQGFLGQYLAHLGRRAAALEICAQNEELLCYRVYAILGMDEEARNGLERRNRRAAMRRPYVEAAVHAQLGDIELALEKLEEAFQMRSPDIIMLAVDPLFDALRGEPRYRRLLDRLGLPG